MPNKSQSLRQPDDPPRDIQKVLTALTSPIRREILDLIWDQELSAGEIAGHFDVTRPAVSQHLAVLREAGLLSERRNGTRRLYRARPEGIADLKAFLDEFWGDRLEALKHEVENREGITDAERG